MIKSDQWVIITISFLILLHLSIFAIGYFTGKFAYLAAFLNIAAGASIILYWATKQIQIVQHSIETREMVVLLFEVAVIGSAVFYIGIDHKHYWLKIMQHLVFGIHLTVLLLGLVFMLTFKLNKLM